VAFKTTNRLKLKMIFSNSIGSTSIRRIVDMKQKHTWSVQIMNELLKGASSYKYGNTGTTPLIDRTDQLNSGTEGSEGEDKNGEGNTVTPPAH
jgi:hypothetical protein